MAVASLYREVISFLLKLVWDIVELWPVLQSKIAAVILAAKATKHLFEACFKQAFPRGEVVSMYVTWEAMLLFCTLVVAIISLVIDIHNKKKITALLTT